MRVLVTVGIRLVFQDAAHRNMFAAKCFDQQASGFIVSHHAHGQNIDAQIRQIMNGVRAASRHDGTFAMFEDQHRRFA